MRQALIWSLACCGIALAWWLFASNNTATDQNPQGTYHAAVPDPSLTDRSALPAAEEPANRAQVAAHPLPGATTEQSKGGEADPNPAPEIPTSSDPMTYLGQTIRGLPIYRSETPKFELNSSSAARDDRLNPMKKVLTAEDAKRLDQSLESSNAAIADISDREWKKRGEAYLAALERGDLVRSVDASDASTTEAKRDFTHQATLQQQLRDLQNTYTGGFVHMVVAGPPTPADKYAKYIVYLHRSSAPDVFALKDEGDRLRQQRADMVRNFLAGLR